MKTQAKEPKFSDSECLLIHACLLLLETPQGIDHLQNMMTALHPKHQMIVRQMIPVIKEKISRYGNHN